MKNETQSALVARDAAIILLLIWAFMQALQLYRLDYFYTFTL